MSEEPILRQGSEGQAGVEELKKQIEELTNKWKRALADYDNLKKDVEREKSAMGDFAKGMAAMEFVGAYDNLKKALAHELDAAHLKQWKTGIQHVKNQFASVLKDLGVEEIKTVGEKFDPQKHEAVGHEAVESAEPDMVIKEAEGGYQMGGRVIKAAKVIVAK